MDINKIHCMDSVEFLKQLEDESIDCTITSPPYWALRDYGIEGQLGLEPTFDEYIDKLCSIFDEVKRVLKKTGTCFVNLGDTYYGGGNNRGSSEENLSKKQLGNRGARGQVQMKWTKDYTSKCLCMIPFRFAIEMCNRGWILRNTIIWHKPNCMPSSAKDRFTVDFEYVFFFTKNKSYYFETQYEPHLTQEKRPDGIVRERTFGYDTKYPEVRGFKTKENIEQPQSPQRRGQDVNYSPQGRNKRCVWNICPKPFSEAHFAVYPQELIEPMIKAGCPKEGVVMDIFMGSGTTGLVAKKLGRNYIGCDLNKEYVEMARKRLDNRLNCKEGDLRKIK